MIEDMGCDVTALKAKIDKIIVKTIISVANNMNKKYKEVRESRQ